MNFKLEKETITLFLEGEINSYNAEQIEKEMLEVLQANTFNAINLDLTSLKYISSAGLRIVLKLKQKYGEVAIINASLEVYDIFEMTGFTNIMTVRKALRKIDISNASEVGDGFFSKVYRIDKDTIVKVFNKTSDPGQVERELRLAKEAFILGIPTAISFDIVQVEEKLGVCFEMLDCDSLKGVVLKNVDRYQEYLDKYVQLLKKINTTECYSPLIPDIKKFYIEKVDSIRPYIGEKYYEKAKRMLSKIEDRRTFVHGDCHFKNIMVQKDELILIDMDTLSVGHPIFELAALYTPYCAFNEDDPGNSERFFGIKDEVAEKIYNSLIDGYLGKNNAEAKDKIKLVSYVHMIWWNRTNEPDNQVRLNGLLSRITKLLDKYGDLDIGI